MQPKKQVGQTSWTVSPLGFGSSAIADLSKVPSDTQAIETIQYALEAGINFFDSAPRYGLGLAEKRLGLALQGIDRERFAIETKVGWILTEDSRVPDFSRDGVLKSLESSLKRLQVDHVDSLLIHDPDDVPCDYLIEETFPALADLRQQGIVKSIGVGINQWEMLVDLMPHTDFDCFLLAQRYTLLNQSALKAIDMFQARGISIFPASLYHTGILATGTQHTGIMRYAGRPAPPEIVTKVQQIEEICAQFDVALPAIALQFVATHPAVTSLLIGMESIQQIQQAISWYQTVIPDDFWRALRASKLIDEAAPLPID